MPQVELFHVDDPDRLARAAASAWLERVRSDQATQSLHYVALSGGRIAKNLLKSAADLATERRHALAHVQFFWADERCVPPNHPHSNYRLAQECLFSQVDISPLHIHRVQGEIPPQEAARLASEAILSSVPLSDHGCPRLSLILLGMGEDGHVASLFPEDPNPGRSSGIYVAVSAPKPPPIRITLTYNVIHAAREVFVLISGPGKENALKCSLTEGSKTPLRQVLLGRTHTTIWTDIAVTAARLNLIE